METVTDMQVEQCPKCRGMREVPSGYDRFGSGLMAWRICPVCDGIGAVEVEPEPVNVESEAA